VASVLVKQETSMHTKELTQERCLIDAANVAHAFVIALVLGTMNSHYIQGKSLISASNARRVLAVCHFLRDMKWCI